MKAFYKILSIATSALFMHLFSLLFFNSDSFITDIGLEPNIASLVIARRAAIFMLGIAVLMFASRNLKSSQTRQIICLFMTITLLGLSCMGTFEFMNQNVNSSIIVSIVIETILWLSFGFVMIKDRKAMYNVIGSNA